MIASDPQTPPPALAEAPVSDATNGAASSLRTRWSERAIVSRLTELLTAEGSDAHAFPPLVQSGPNSALPHGGPTERTLREGEPLLIDYGGRKRGYPADITRTMFCGRPSAELGRVFEVVSAANRAAIAAVGPGAARGGCFRQPGGAGETQRHRSPLGGASAGEAGRRVDG